MFSMSDILPGADPYWLCSDGMWSGGRNFTMLWSVRVFSIASGAKKYVLSVVVDSIHRNGIGRYLHVLTTIFHPDTDGQTYTNIKGLL